MRLIKLSFTLILLLNFSSLAIAETDNIDEKTPTLIEIEDKYNEVKLCLTKSSIYMQFKNSVKEYTNQEIEYRYNIEANQFIDSQGHFLLGEVTLLDSDKIEYVFAEIQEVSFANGKLVFTYQDPKAFTFSDILNTDGTPALQNFYVEDLERFYLTYAKLTAVSSK